MPLQDRWIQDKKACLELQKLKKFVDFVAAMPGVTEEQKENAEVINWLIENIDKPETYKKWWAKVSIRFGDDYDESPPARIIDKSWSVMFDDNILYINASAELNIIAPSYYAESADSYSLELKLDSHNPSAPLIIDTPIDDFVAKGMDYKRHITDETSEIEIELLINEFY